MSSITSGVMSSKTDQWFTPPALIQTITRWVGQGPFDLDVAADADNAKARRYYTAEMNALTLPWWGKNVWLNPPYGRLIQDFSQKAIDELNSGRCKRLTMLVPARTDTKWFQLLAQNATNIHFIQGRIKFEGPNDTGSAAPFPSAVLHFAGHAMGDPVTTYGPV